MAYVSDVPSLANTDEYPELDGVLRRLKIFCQDHKIVMTEVNLVNKENFVTANAVFTVSPYSSVRFYETEALIVTQNKIRQHAKAFFPDLQQLSFGAISFTDPDKKSDAR